MSGYPRTGRKELWLDTQRAEQQTQEKENMQGKSGRLDAMIPRRTYNLDYKENIRISTGV